MRRTAVALGLAALVGLPAAVEPLVAQGTSAGEESGIWIADARGELRRVEPVAGGRLEGIRRQPPASRDVVVVLSVETFAHTATGAISAGELAVSRVIGAASTAGVAASSVRREPPIVRALYERPGVLTATWEKPRLEGYVAAHVITLRTPNPHRIGLLLDLTNGAGATRVLRVGPERPAGW